MASQIEKHEFTGPDGKKIVVALLDNGAVRVRFNDLQTGVTWHATGMGKNSVTVITPQRV